MLIPTIVLFNWVRETLLETALKELNLTPEETVKIHGYRELPFPRPQERSYKAAPRDGVWAEPPYMHNGSVPNLYEMLIPAAQRTKKFYVGESRSGQGGSGHYWKFWEVSSSIRLWREIQTPDIRLKTVLLETELSVLC